MSIVDVGMAVNTEASYPKAPFDPPDLYPEFVGSSLHNQSLDTTNSVYPLVREALFRHLGGYNCETNTIDLASLRKLGTPKKIVVKPNWVREQSELSDCTTTHASILRPLLDYLFLAFGYTTQIVVADIPLQSADLNQIWKETGSADLLGYYRSKGLPVSFLDLRREKAVVDSTGFVLKREILSGDPLGYVEVSLGRGSYLEEVSYPSTVFSVNDYEPGNATCYHQAGRHSYLIARTVLDSDLFVNVPKMKTHCKAGITVSMKNLIGINGDKGWIPHFRIGAPHDQGDEHPDRGRLVMNWKSKIRNSLQERHRSTFHVAQLIWKSCKKKWEDASGRHINSGGAWFGNDTLWRSILDLVEIITFASPEGKLMGKPQRYHLCLVDGIVCGQGEGPLRPSPKSVGVVLCASNPINADWAACQMMAFDWSKIPQLYNAQSFGERWEWFSKTPDSLTVSWSRADPDGCALHNLPVFPFVPSSGWLGHIEQAIASDIRVSC